MSKMELYTKDLVLRTVNEEDISEVARMWSYEQETIPIEEAKAAVDFMLSNHQRNKTGCIYHLCLAVFEKQQANIIGWCGFDGRTAGRLDIFYSIDPAFRNKGYATQCAERLLSYAFDEAEVSAVNGGCDRNNIASYRVMQKIGMMENGFEDNGDPRFFIDRNTYLKNERRFLN